MLFLDGTKVGDCVVEQHLGSLSMVMLVVACDVETYAVSCMFASADRCLCANANERFQCSPFPEPTLVVLTVLLFLGCGLCLFNSSTLLSFFSTFFITFLLLHFIFLISILHLIFIALFFVYFTMTTTILQNQHAFKFWYEAAACIA